MKTSLRTRTVAIASNGNAKIGPSKGRRYLAISLASGRAFALAGGTTPDAASGIFVTSQTGWIGFCYEDLGSGIDDDWTIYNQAAQADTVVILETVAAL